MRKQLYMQNEKWSLLLDLYFKGDTTVKQEQQLRKYFRKGKIAPEHKKFASLFNYIDNEDVSVVNRRLIQNYRRIILSVAAVAVLLVGGILLKFELNSKNDNYDNKLYKLVIDGVEVNDKQLAINIVQDKLDIINNAMGRVNIQTQKITKATEITRKIKIKNIN